MEKVNQWVSTYIQLSRTFAVIRIAMAVNNLSRYKATFSFWEINISFSKNKYNRSVNIIDIMR